MSEYTQCNYCSLRSIKNRAREKGKKVSINPPGIPKKFSGRMGGTEVYVHDKDKEPGEDDFVSWFMELTNHCCC